ncbi:TAP42 [Sanghuangporus weigelae]
MSSEASIPLQALYSRGLKAASKASSLPTIEDETQKLVESALEDLNLLSSRIQDLGLFSPNESLDEVTTRDLVYMTVPFVLGELESNARATERDDRLRRLRSSQAHFRAYVSLLGSYNVIPEEEKKLYGQKASAVSDALKRREVKIAQFKKEKEIKNRISALRSSRRLPEVDTSNVYDLVDSILTTSTGQEEDSEDAIRETILLLLRLQWAQTAAHIESMNQELELLAKAPREEREERTVSEKSSEDEIWRLEAPSTSLLNKQGPLLDVHGKPLRPFTILPASAGERAHLESEVFRPDHRLPTMTIDQYLEEEGRRGNIISGGGPQSAAGPTRKEQLAINAEMEGSRFGEEKAEEKRLEDERWAQFTDRHPRGAGNTMNRG